LGRSASTHLNSFGVLCELQKKLAALQTLELFNCDIAQADDYRDKIFDLLESVLYVDGVDREGEPAPDDDEADDYDGDYRDAWIIIISAKCLFFVNLLFCA